MAKIVGGIGASHTPTIGFAKDHKKQNDPAWAPIFKDFEKVRSWLSEKKVDVMFLIFNDHITSFFFDHYSAFTLGVDDQYQTADEGGGAREYPAVAGDQAFSRHIAFSMMSEEFDISTFQKKPLDHGCFSPLSMLADTDWEGALIPFQVGVLQLPIPNARRCYKLGKALRRAIESYPEDLNVAVVATGGLSHQVHGERCGFNNTDWDEQFLDLITESPEQLCDYTIADYARLGGMEGAEIIMWLIMRGALSDTVNCVHRSTYLPSMTNIATLVLEDLGSGEQLDAETYRAQVYREYQGADQLMGTYPFSLETSNKKFRLNAFLHSLVIPEFRARFLSDFDALATEYGLTDEEKNLIETRDWIGLIHYGVIFFMLEKLGAVLGVPNPVIYASMRGETMEQFQATRNAAINYGVAKA